MIINFLIGCGLPRPTCGFAYSVTSPAVFVQALNFKHRLVKVSLTTQMQSDGTLTGLYPVSTPVQSPCDVRFCCFCGSEGTVVRPPEPPDPKNKKQTKKPKTKPKHDRRNHLRFTVTLKSVVIHILHEHTHSLSSWFCRQWGIFLPREQQHLN